ncbi:MAG: DUF493 domain-containing protein [Proteobacteria bacterium]|nr:DUF493 domain-containing protein [Pseudomonadota bacterium]MBU1686492.1 DUF493 domain-containing protein [Pseudomonadota bacterium]
MPSCQSGPEIEYPCRWQYTIIGTHREQLRDLIEEIADSRQYTLCFSKVSSSGKYHSFDLDIEVRCQEERDALYQQLICHNLVKVIL